VEPVVSAAPASVEAEGRWLEENKDAIASINSFIDRHRILAGKFRYRPPPLESGAPAE
jgi:post-segregation antitoxin (ccd killing protein)